MSLRKAFLILIFLSLSNATVLLALGNSGAVYTMTNDPAGNNVLVFNRKANGNLTAGGTFSTEGLGTGAPLGNQGAVVLNENKKLLLVVNPGSDELSLFTVRKKELVLKDTVPSGGRNPISVTVHDDLVYVLNAGGNVGDTDNISGFTIERRRNLVPIPNSTLPLSAAATNPAQISFDLDGDILIVTEKDTNIINSYTVDENGNPTGPNSHPAAGIEPFGFAISSRHKLFISEASGGAADAGAVSTYDFEDDGTITNVNPSVPTTETATCWVVLTKNQKFAYVTNTGSASITGFAVQDATITLLDSDGVTATTGAMPIDLALSKNSRYLYSLNSGNGSISMFRINNEDGSLTSLGPDLIGLPPTANGLAAK
jgi:6-phosphogluconolactonase (cycloisomerase 2 family)